MMDLPKWISPRIRQAVITMRRLYREGETSPKAVREALGMGETQYRSMLHRLTGATRWPVEISEEYLRVPVRDGGRDFPDDASAPRPKKLSDEDIAARIERDQARIRARRDFWRREEQRKYGLPRPHRPIEDMPV